MLRSKVLVLLLRAARGIFHATNFTEDVDQQTETYIKMQALPPEKEHTYIAAIFILILDLKLIYFAIFKARECSSSLEMKFVRALFSTLTNYISIGRL